MTNGSNSLVGDMTWRHVEQRLAAGASAIVPIGAGAKQHGLHLPMATDRIQAEWFAARIAEKIDALVWPTLTYGFYPAFAAYAGSVSLSQAAFEQSVREIVAELDRFGARIVLVLDTGLSTIAPVTRALARTGTRHAIVKHLKIHSGDRYRAAVQDLSQQTHGSHADEIETSIMLAIHPEKVALPLAQDSPLPSGGVRPGPLTPMDATSANYAPSGSFGQPTLATAEKGRAVVEAILADLAEQVEGLARVHP